MANENKNKNKKGKNIMYELLYKQGSGWLFYKENGVTFITDDINIAEEKYRTLLETYGAAYLKLIDENKTEIFVKASGKKATYVPFSWDYQYAEPPDTAGDNEIRFRFDLTYEGYKATGVDLDMLDTFVGYWEGYFGDPGMIIDDSQLKDVIIRYPGEEFGPPEGQLSLVVRYTGDVAVHGTWSFETPKGFVKLVRDEFPQLTYASDKCFCFRAGDPLPSNES